MDYSILGKNIKKYRQLKGLRQSDLAEMAGCGSSHIGQLENGRGTPSLEIAINIANALEVTVDQLLVGYYNRPDMVYLKEISERIESYQVKQRIMACEGVLNYLKTLEDFNR